jgi:peptide/nickel transport system permease protein
VSPAREAWRRFRRHRPAAAGAALAAGIVLVSAAAPFLAPHPPTAILDPVGLQAVPPSLAHPLGTDALGRDVVSRLLHGARVSLLVGVAAAALAALIAGAIGFAAGLGGPRLDGALMRGVDVLLALPRLLLVMTLFALWDHLPLALVVALLGATGWFALARLVRARVRELARADFVTAAVALGAGRRRVARHLLPHVAATLLVGATLDVGNIILLEAGLSFLGLGVAPPTPTWGNMILEGRALLFSAPWVALAPGVALVCTAAAFNLLGDGLRDALDPRWSR